MNRLRDAEVLFRARRYDSAVYLCGYAMEIALKARICKTLGWGEFPSSGSDFRNYTSLRTHDLEVLLHFSGVERRIKTRLLPEWSIVSEWDPETRYQPAGQVSRTDARLMIEAAKKVMDGL